jgi:hypothetical protein
MPSGDGATVVKLWDLAKGVAAKNIPAANTIAMNFEKNFMTGVPVMAL